MPDPVTTPPSAHRRLLLPPLFAAEWVDSAADIAAAAATRAATAGAGTLVWSHRPGAAPGRLDFAVVLEPDEPLADARRAHLAGMAALAEALAAHCPPDRAVRIAWNGAVIFDTSRLGGARLVVPPGTAEDAVPDWLVFAVELIADRDHLPDPGAVPGSISLAEEGFADPAAIIESFAAHLMRQFDRWKHQGFAAVAAALAPRLDGGGTIAEDGTLARGPARITLAAGLRDTPWRDAEGPRL